MGSVLCGISASHQDIIQIHEDEGQASTHGIHQSLEGLRSVLQPEWCSEKFVWTERGDNSRLVYILACHWNLVVSWNQVNFGKDLAACELSRKILYVGDWVLVGDGDIIEAPEVAARPP